MKHEASKVCGQWFSVPPESLAMQTANHGFTTTHWSTILLATEPTGAESMAALDRLCRTYWFPIYAYVRRRGYEVEEAKDLTQAFFARFLEKEFLSRVDAKKGKFRSVLVASVNHFLANERERGQTLKRGGGWQFISLDQVEEERFGGLEAMAGVAPEKVFEREWALALLDQALHCLREEFVAAGKGAHFERLKCFLSCEGGEPSYAQLAQEWGTTPNAVAAAVHRLRQRYRECVRDQIAQTVAGPEELESELRSLFAALG
jgi:DNA-directed RNA polymerase specialized sigma24 family protein